MTRSWRVAALALAAFGALALWQHRERTLGAADERIATLQHQRDAARALSVTARTDYIHTTDTLVRVIDRSGAVVDSARALVTRERRAADSLRTRVAEISADSSRADSALNYLIAQNDTLRTTVEMVAAQRDTLASAATRAITAAHAALSATDTLSNLNARIATEALRVAHSHFSTQFGVGACATRAGVSPCAYVGFGYHR